MSDTPYGSNFDVAQTYFNSQGSYGVLVRWDRINTSNVVKYNILRSTHFDGTYELIDSVPFPQDEYIDAEGHPNFYYKIQEVNSSDTVIATSQPFSGDEQLILASVIHQVRQFMRIYVQDEEVVFEGTNRTWARVGYNNWNYWPRPQVRISGYSNDGDSSAVKTLSENTPLYTTIEGSDNYEDGLIYKLDYQGRVYFLNATDGTPYPIHEYDTVYVSYAVKMITNYEINEAVNFALQRIAAQPGAPKITSLAGAPDYYEQAVVEGATFWLLRMLLSGLNNREWRLLLQDPEANSYDTIKEVRETAKMYEEWFKETLKTLPISKYPRIAAIVGQTHMLPGGRSRFFRSMWKGTYG